MATTAKATNYTPFIPCFGVDNTQDIVECILSKNKSSTTELSTYKSYKNDIISGKIWQDDTSSGGISTEDKIDELLS